jgi:hypothetical protein
LETRPHFVTDSAFGSFVTMNKVLQWGGLWTTAMASHNSPQLWQLLSYNCSPNHWRAAMNDEDIIISSHTLKTDNAKLVYQRILTCGFNGTMATAYEDVITSSYSGFS